MNNFEKLKSMTVSELADWLDKYGQFDGSPWMDWFNEKYCSKCEPIKCTIKDSDKVGIKPLWIERLIECSYCELEHKCKFFEELEDIPDNKETIKMWLMQEANND